MQKGILKISLKKNILFTVITVSIFLFLFRLFNFDLTQLIKLDKGYLLIAIIITLPFPILSALRWWYVLRGMEIEIGFKKSFQLVFGSWVLAIFPGRIGDFVRVIGLPPDIPAQTSLSSVFFEKIIDILILLLFSLVGFLFAGNAIGFMLILLSLIVIPLSIFLLPQYVIRVVPHFIGEKIAFANKALIALVKKPSAILMASCMSGVNWFLSIIQVYFLFLAVGANVPIAEIFAWLPLAIFVGLIPITLAGMGIRDFALIYFFTPLASTNQILGVGIWYSLLVYWFLAIIGLPWLHHLFKKDDPSE